METKLLNLKGQEVGKVALPEVLFSVKPDPFFIHEVMNYYQANKVSKNKVKQDAGKKPAAKPAAKK